MTARAWPPGQEPLRHVLADGVRGPLQLCLLAAIRAYQLLLSPLFGPVCRFYPSCSHYAFEAVRTHGALRGAGYTVGRLARCHPWNPGGVDPVPPPRTLRRRRRRPAAAGTPPPDRGGAAAQLSSPALPQQGA